MRILFGSIKPGPLGQVRGNWLCLYQYSINMLSTVASWRAPFQGANQSQVLWAWILYLLPIPEASLLSDFSNVRAITTCNLTGIAIIVLSNESGS